MPQDIAVNLPSRDPLTDAINNMIESLNSFLDYSLETSIDVNYKHIINVVLQVLSNKAWSNRGRLWKDRSIVTQSTWLGF